MKYTRIAYDEVIAAFDRTIKNAKDSREAILFNCIDISTVNTMFERHACPKYCPFYDDCHDPYKKEKRLYSTEWEKQKTEFESTARRYFEI